MRKIALCLIGLLMISTMPLSSAGGNSYTGLQLSRPEIEDFTLTDQDGNPHSLQSNLAEATVIAFIFTTCEDACPAITQKLRSVQNMVSTEEVEFISITVDPAIDTPEVFKSYMEKHNVSWPHLTGTTAQLQPVWDAFFIQTQDVEITIDRDMDHSDTVTVVMPNNTSFESEVMPMGWQQFVASAHQEDWTFNASESQYEHFVSSINNDSTPSDHSWWWQLHSWNDSTSIWEEVSVGIDSIEVGRLAFAPNSTNDSMIPIPGLNNESMTIVQLDGNSSTAVISEINAWHQTIAALDEVETPDSDFGHYLTSINNVSAPADLSWWWQLHFWNDTSMTWEESQSGMDLLTEQMHIAWAPNSTDDSDIPIPNTMAKHHDNSVAHSVLTFILDNEWKPIVSWSGYQWNEAEFAHDIETVMASHDHPEDTDDHSVPGFTFGLIASALGLAIIATSKEE
jgi:protein SCO1/2